MSHARSFGEQDFRDRLLDWCDRAGLKQAGMGTDEIIRSIPPPLRVTLSKALSRKYGNMKIESEFISYAKRINPQGFRERLLDWGKRSGIQMDSSAPTSVILACLSDAHTVKLNAVMRKTVSDPRHPLVSQGIGRRVSLAVALTIKISYYLCSWGIYADTEVRQYLVTQDWPLSLWGKSDPVEVAI